MAESLACLGLPGTLCDARLFAPMQKAWSALSFRPAMRIADLHGLRHARQAWWAAQLEGLPARFDVLGFSLGGLLAFELLAQAPERVRRLVLMASNPMAGTPAHAQRVALQRAHWRDRGAAAVAGQMVAEASPRAASAILPVVQQMAQATPGPAFVAQGDLNASRPDGIPVLTHWPGELLLISGQDDPWCGADKQALMRQARADAQWIELPDCGHYLPLEQPHRLAELTCEFLAAASPRSNR